MPAAYPEQLRRKSHGTGLREYESLSAVQCTQREIRPTGRQPAGRESPRNTNPPSLGPPIPDLTAETHRLDTTLRPGQGGGASPSPLPTKPRGAAKPPQRGATCRTRVPVPNPGKGMRTGVSEGNSFPFQEVLPCGGGSLSRDRLPILPIRGECPRGRWRIRSLAG